MRGRGEVRGGRSKRRPYRREPIQAAGSFSLFLLAVTPTTASICALLQRLGVGSTLPLPPPGQGHTGTHGVGNGERGRVCCQPRQRRRRGGGRVTLAGTAKRASFSVPQRWGKKKKSLGASLLLPLLMVLPWLLLVLGTKTNATSSVFRLAVEHDAHRFGKSSHTREAHFLETPSTTTTASAAFPALSSLIHVSVFQ